MTEPALGTSYNFTIHEIIGMQLSTAKNENKYIKYETKIYA